MKIFYKNIFVGINLFWLTCFTNYCTITICCFKSIFINIPLFLATYFCIYSGVHLNWDSQQGRVRTTSILVWAFWNFKCQVLKYFRTCSLHNTLIPNLVKPLLYMYFACRDGKPLRLSVSLFWCHATQIRWDFHYIFLVYICMNKMYLLIWMYEYLLWICHYLQ